MQRSHLAHAFRHTRTALRRERAACMERRIDPRPDVRHSRSDPAVVCPQKPFLAPLSHESMVVTLSTSSFWLIPSRCAPTRSWSMLRPPWSSWCSCPPKRRPDEDAGTAMQVSSTRDQSAGLTLGVPATIAAAASLRGDTVCTEWPPHGVRRRLDTRAAFGVRARVFPRRLSRTKLDFRGVSEFFRVINFQTRTWKSHRIL